MTDAAPAPVLRLVDSITELSPADARCVAVSGSHGGASSARYAIAARPLLSVFNDAGTGKRDAGIAALAMLQAEGLAACTVAHDSAAIGYARSTLEEGIVSHANALALQLGVETGRALRGQSLVVRARGDSRSASQPHEENAMHPDARYLFTASMDVAPEKEALFNEVYDTEHIPFLLQVPGVLSAVRCTNEPLELRIAGERRHISVPGEPKYSAIYELTGPDVLVSDAWAAAVDKGRWPTEVRPFVSNHRHTLRKLMRR